MPGRGRRGQPEKPGLFAYNLGPKVRPIAGFSTTSNASLPVFVSLFAPAAKGGGIRAFRTLYCINELANTVAVTSPACLAVVP